MAANVGGENSGFRVPNLGVSQADWGARAEILSRIAGAGAGAPVEAGADELAVAAAPVEGSRAEIVERFAEYAAEYTARIFRTSEAGLPKVLAELLPSGSVVPEDLPPAWYPGGRVDDGLSVAELASTESVLTACAVAIAETGTVVLDSGVGQGRRVLSLLPDHHVCVVREDQVVASVPDAVAVLGDAVAAGRPLTWISGPSATSDIELSRVEGVHGPRRLDIVIVG